MYPVYELQVYDHVQKEWIHCTGTEASNRPHHYDVLRARFDRLVREAKDDSSSQAPIGYRITSNGQPVDTWTNEKKSAKLIGLSLAQCVLDLAFGKVKRGDVDKIITSTRYVTNADWFLAVSDKIAPLGPWQKTSHIACLELLSWLLRNDKIVQPRLENNRHFPNLANGRIWVRSENEIVWDDQSD